MIEKIFEEGTRLDVQFSYKGQIGIPDLWHLDFDALNSIYKSLFSLKKSSSEESLLKTRKKEDEILDLKIAIVKHIFEVKQEEENERKERANNKKQVEFYDKIIEQKQNQAVLDLPIEKIIEMRDGLK